MSINFEQGRIGLPIGIPLKSKRFLEDEGIPPARLPNHKSCVKDNNELNAVQKEIVESKEGSETESNNQNLGLNTRKGTNSLLAQKMAILEGGIISSNSFFRALNGKENVTHSTKTEKTKNTLDNPGSGNTVEKHSSSLERLSKSSSQEEGVDPCYDKTDAPFQNFISKDTLLEPEALDACPGATAKNPSEDSDKHNMTGNNCSINMFTHDSSESFALSETIEEILSATLVEVEIEDEENGSRSPTSLPVVEATIMVDTKSWRKRFFLLFGCCFLVFILVGTLFIFDALTGGQPPPNSYEWVTVGQRLTESEGDRYGSAVSLSSDGCTLAVGAHKGGDINSSMQDSGHVLVYQFKDNTWNQHGKKIVGQDKDRSGQCVSLSDDGDTIAIGSPNRNIVRVYRLVDSKWEKLGTDIETEQEEGADGFSTSYVYLSGNGLHVAVGSPNSKGEKGNYTGQVRVYEYKDNWKQRGNGIEGQQGDNLGFSVWLNRDGSILAVGAFQNTGKGAYGGYAQVYHLSKGDWKPLGESLQGEKAGDHFGTSVSMSDDVSTLAVGADMGRKSKGYVRVFEWNEKEKKWVQLGMDICGEAKGDLAGLDSAISNDGQIIVVGSRKSVNDESESLAGNVRMFQYNKRDLSWEPMGSPIWGHSNDHLGISVSLAKNGTIVAVGTYLGNYAEVFQLTYV